MQTAGTITIRLTPKHLSKIDKMAAANDCKRSWVLRQLVDRAELITPALFAGSWALDTSIDRNNVVAEMPDGQEEVISG